MRVFWSLSALSLVFLTTTGCITGHVAEVTRDWGRPSAERLTATGVSGPWDVRALEGECRIAPAEATGPEGGPAARPYTLERVNDRELAASLDPELETIATYRSYSDERAAPPGFPDAVVVARERDEPRMFLRLPSGWTSVPVERFHHEDASDGHPVLAGVARVFLVPPAVVADLATFPVQWILAVWFGITPDAS